MIEILGDEHRIQKILPPDATDFNDEAYSAAVLKEIGVDKSIEDLRQSSINRATTDLEEATAMNLKNGVPADKVIPIHLKSIAAIEQYYKDKKSYELAHEAADEKSFESYVTNNPQALLNYANNGELNYDNIQDSRILNFQYKLSKTVNAENFSMDLVARMGTDIAMGVAGNAMQRYNSPIIKAGGKFLSSYGAGNAKDYVLLNGRTIAETGEMLRKRYFDILGMDLTDKEFEEEVDKFIKDFTQIPEPYREEQLDHILHNVSPYADAGGAGLAYGISSSVKPIATMIRLKNIARYLGKKKNTVNDNLMKEMDDLTTEKVESPVETISQKLPDEMSVEEKDIQIAGEIDARKRTSLSSTRGSNVQVIAEPRTVDAEIIPPSKVTPYSPRMLESPKVIEAETMPSGLLKYEEPVIYMPQEEQLQLQFRTVMDDSIDNPVEMFRKPIVRTDDWDSRRITYIDDNGGRGYTLEEASDLVTVYEDELASTYRRGNRAVLTKKKYSWGQEYEEMDWIDKGYDYEYQSVSAAAPVPFGRAANTLETTDTGATGAMHGNGPYASIHAEDPASLAHYKKGLDESYFESAMYRAKQNTDDEFDSALETLIKVTNTDRFKVFGEANEYLKAVHKGMLDESVMGYEDVLTALKKAKKEVHKFNTTNHSPVEHPHTLRISSILSDKWLGDMIERYKQGRASVMNYWYGVTPESQPTHWIDQRDYKHLYHSQNSAVRKGLDAYRKEFIEKLAKAELLGDSKVSKDAAIKNEIYDILFAESVNDFRHKVDWDNIETLSEQEPAFIRLAMDEVEGIDWEGLYKELKQDLYGDEVDLIEKLLVYSGRELQRSMLVDKGIWGNVHSRSNVVFYKQTPAQMSNVYKQTWNQGGQHYTKLLDSGAFPLYDSNLQAFTVKVSVVVPGKGRKPVLLNKQKIKKWSK